MLNTKCQHSVCFLLVTILIVVSFRINAANELAPVFNNYIEAGVNHHGLTNNYGDWDGGYLQGVWQQNDSNKWDWEILGQERYAESGIYYVAGLTHIFDQDWYGSVHAGASSSGFFFPDYRIDAYLHRKVLPERNLVLTAGIGYIEQEDAHTDRYLYLGAGYYFPDAWLIEGGIRLNRSSPGAISSNRYVLALSQARDKVRHIAFTLDWGDEAYLATGPATILVDFPSTLLVINWREWLGEEYGLHMIVEHYESDFFNRNGISVGVFREF